MVLYVEDNGKALLFCTVCQKAIITYLLKSLRKDMMQKSAYELFVGEGNDFPLIGTIILGAERDFTIFSGYYS